MTRTPDQPPPAPRPDDDAAGPLDYGDRSASPRRTTARQGGIVAGVFSTLVLAFAVVLGGASAMEQPEKRWQILASWGGGLVIVLVVIGLARWRGTPGVVPGALIGIGLTALFAGWCYTAS